MRKKLGITIISDVSDILTKVTAFANHIDEKTILDLPHVFNALAEWELKNTGYLTPSERNDFSILKNRIENLVNEFKTASV